MRGWLLDTNVIASLVATDGAPSVKAWAGQQDEARMYLSVLTLAEYDGGIARLQDNDPLRGRYAADRDAIEHRFRDRVLPVSDAVVRLWGTVSGRIKRDTGHPPAVIDTLLAATAMDAGLYLVSRNVKDLRHTGAALFNPWQDEISGFPLTSV